MASAVTGTLPLRYILLVCIWMKSPRLSRIFRCRYMQRSMTRPDGSGRKKARKTQEERSAATTALLVAAARELFAKRGFAETATEDILKEAGVTRGALYHHFDSKAALFRAVLESE